VTRIAPEIARKYEEIGRRVVESAIADAVARRDGAGQPSVTISIPVTLAFSTAVDSEEERTNPKHLDCMQFCIAGWCVG